MKKFPLNIPVGVNPSPDSTALDSMLWTDSNRIRFVGNRFQSVGGCEEVSTGSDTMKGFARFCIHYRKDSNSVFTIIGTHSKLYAVLGNVRTNITPLKTSGTTLGANPIATTNLSKQITITHSTHGFSAGDRIKISGASAVGGIGTGELNAEFIIDTVVDANTYKVTVTTTAASSTTTGGGAAVVVYAEIGAGRINESLGYGYGMGKYGVGLYGVAKTGFYPVMPRIWSGDLFGTKVILCPGTTDANIGASIYEWDGDTSEAPTVVTNAPTNCTYVFVDNNQVVALCDNTIKWSDVGDQTVWTADATNSAGEREFYGAGRLLTREYVNGENLIYSATNVWRFRSIGKPNIWLSEPLEVADGIAGVHATGSLNGVAYWLGRKNVYQYSGGGAVPLLPETLRQWLFADIDKSQMIKSHVLVNAEYNELWFFYQSTSSTTDVNKYVKYSVLANCWDKGLWDRTGSEFNSLFNYPRLLGSTGNDTSSTCKLYEHERGLNDNGSALNWYIESNYGQIGEGDETFYIMGIMHDSVQTGTAQFTCKTKLSPMSTAERTFGAYTLAASSSSPIYKIDFRAHGRMRKCKFSSDATNSFFRQGKIEELLVRGDGR